MQLTSAQELAKVALADALEACEGCGDAETSRIRELQRKVEHAVFLARLAEAELERHHRSDAGDR